MAYVFISHSSQDDDYVNKLVSHLNIRGIETWVDHLNLPFGEKVSLEVFNVLKDASAFIVVMTTKAIESNWVEPEIKEAKDLNKKIFPILLEGDGFKTLTNYHHEDVRASKRMPSDKFCKQLLEYLATQSANPLDEAPAPPKTSPIKASAPKNPPISKIVGGVFFTAVLLIVLYGLFPKPDELQSGLGETRTAVSTATSAITVTHPTNIISAQNTIDIVRGRGVIGITNRNAADLSNITVDFGNNEAYLLGSILSGTRNSEAGKTWCIIQPQNATSLDSCSDASTYTTPDTRNSWRNSVIIFRREGAIIGECRANPVEVNEFVCTTFNF